MVCRSAVLTPLLGLLIGASIVAEAAPAPTTANSPWQKLANLPAFVPGAMLLLRDGTVMVQDNGPRNNGTRNWWRLRPDPDGSYVNGTWSHMGSLPAGYAPLFFASAMSFFACFLNFARSSRSAGTTPWQLPSSLR